MGMQCARFGFWPDSESPVLSKLVRLLGKTGRRSVGLDPPLVIEGDIFSTSRHHLVGAEQE